MQIFPYAKDNARVKDLAVFSPPFKLFVMKIKHWFTFGCWFVVSLTTAQNSVFDLNFEFQAYPTGLIPGLRLEKGFAGKHALHLRGGYQLIDHRDLGKHDDETGQGYGFTAGYKRYFKEEYKGFHLGLRNDIWFNTIDWTTNAPPSKGTTKIVVLQPTAEAGWLFLLGSHFTLTPSLALGYEINVKTEGEPTGEGMILLIGLQTGYRF